MKARAAREFSAASDAELILHAYDAWGEQCVEHILGDFSFVLWDSRRHCLFCARDHLGIRPLYYAEIGQCLLVSNTLDCLRQLDAVPTDLNDQAIRFITEDRKITSKDSRSCCEPPLATD